MPNSNPRVPLPGRSKVGQMIQTIQAFAQGNSKAVGAGVKSPPVQNVTVNQVNVGASSPVIITVIGGKQVIGLSPSVIPTRVTLAPPPNIPSPAAGQVYLLAGDFSDAGIFSDEDCVTTLTSSASGLSIKREESLCTPSKQAWTVQVLSGFSPSPNCGGGIAFNPPSVKNTGWTGGGVQNLTTVWTVSEVV